MQRYKDHAIFALITLGLLVLDMVEAEALTNAQMMMLEVTAARVGP